jgi:outer membrane protein assembly factor BamB
VRSRRARVMAVAILALAATSLAGCVVLEHQWTAQTGYRIAAKPVVSGGTVFIGSWDGYEYAFDAQSGAQKWRTFLGQTRDTCPEDITVGVTSAPQVQNGVAYLGGGDSNWYALDAQTGSVLWTVPTGDNSPSGGHYNWSSPAIHNGAAYVGIASLCDRPLVQGKLLRVSLSTHQIANVWKVVPDGQVGGTIWTSPVVDAARNTVFVTTGNRAWDSTGATQQHAEAMVALDATTLAVKSYWSLPVADPTPDADWGTSPTLFTDSSGRALVSAANKNGILYAFNRDNLGAGPVWQVRLAQAAAGDDPGAGGVYSNGFFDGQRLYYGGGRTTIRGTTYEASIRAIDPATGRFIWEAAIPRKPFGALTGANGMIVVPAFQPALYGFEAATGKVAFWNPLGEGNWLYGASTIANGLLYYGDGFGVVHALRFPASPPPAPEGASVAVAAAATSVRLDGSPPPQPPFVTDTP